MGSNKLNFKTSFTATLFIFAVTGCASSKNSVQSGREVAAIQSSVVPFENLNARKVLTPGKTFLAFMRDELKPAMDAQYQANKEVQAKYPSQYSKWQSVLIQSGTGVAVRIDNNNYYFNVGYTDTPDAQEVHSPIKDNDTDEGDAKSGRSYGIGPTRRQSDPSYPFYLRELTDYLKKEPQNIEKFYRALTLVLVNCDTSGWKALSTEGQVVATDYLAIYTAELYRHMVMNLRPHSHPWEIDMSGITFVAPFSVKTGQIIRDGKLVNSDLLGWIGKNETTGSSGVGFTRNDRKLLTAQFTRSAIDNKGGEASIRAINKAIGGRADDDVIQGFFEFLNSPDYRGAKLSQDQISTLTRYLPTVVAKTYSDAKKIADAFDDQ
ncbi:MAG: hypothetical protein JST16_12245 [Bdellovibrionales bacterium]|nr:hypothetical protein [Bdellovibrionales bacterium]